MQHSETVELSKTHRLCGVKKKKSPGLQLVLMIYQSEWCGAIPDMFHRIITT